MNEKNPSNSELAELTLRVSLREAHEALSLTLIRAVNYLIDELWGHEELEWNPNYPELPPKSLTQLYEWEEFCEAQLARCFVDRRMVSEFYALRQTSKKGGIFINQTVYRQARFICELIRELRDSPRPLAPADDSLPHFTERCANCGQRIRSKAYVSWVSRDDTRALFLCALVCPSCKTFNAWKCREGEDGVLGYSETLVPSEPHYMTCALPEQLAPEAREFLGQARNAIRNGQAALAVQGVGSAIEIVLKLLDGQTLRPAGEFDPQKMGQLVDGVVSKGLLPPPIESALRKTVSLRNSTTHQRITPSEFEARLALEATIDLIHYSYVWPEQANRMAAAEEVRKKGRQERE